MDNKFLTSIVIVILIALTGITAFKDSNIIVNVPSQGFGAIAGPDVSFPMSFNEGVVNGGRTASSTTSTTGTLLAAQIEKYTMLDYTLNLADVTLTFPATSTIGFMNKAGDVKEFYVRNATTTATMDITFAQGTGMNFKNSSTTKVLIGDTDGGNMAKVTLIRRANSDIDMYLDLYVEEQ